MHRRPSPPSSAALSPIPRHYQPQPNLISAPLLHHHGLCGREMRMRSPAPLIGGNERYFPGYRSPQPAQRTKPHEPVRRQFATADLLKAHQPNPGGQGCGAH